MKRAQREESGLRIGASAIQNGIGRNFGAVALIQRKLQNTSDAAKRQRRGNVPSGQIAKRSWKSTAKHAD